MMRSVVIGLMLVGTAMPGLAVAQEEGHRPDNPRKWAEHRGEPPVEGQRGGPGGQPRPAPQAQFAPQGQPGPRPDPRGGEFRGGFGARAEGRPQGQFPGQYRGQFQGQAQAQQQPGFQRSDRIDADARGDGRFQGYRNRQGYPGQGDVAIAPGSGGYRPQPGQYGYRGDGRPGLAPGSGGYRPQPGQYGYRPGDNRAGYDPGRYGDRRGFAGTYGSGNYGGGYRPAPRPGPDGGWNRRWRDDRHYDYRSYRTENRFVFRVDNYYAPRGWSYGYRRFSPGITLNTFLFAQDYWIDDPYTYRLPPVWGPYRWVRYYNDALLVDVRSGLVVDTVYGIFWQ